MKKNERLVFAKVRKLETCHTASIGYLYPRFFAIDKLTLLNHDEFSQVGNEKSIITEAELY